LILLLPFALVADSCRDLPDRQHRHRVVGHAHQLGAPAFGAPPVKAHQSSFGSLPSILSHPSGSSRSNPFLDAQRSAQNTASARVSPPWGRPNTLTMLSF